MFKYVASLIIIMKVLCFYCSELEIGRNVPSSRMKQVDFEDNEIKTKKAFLLFTCINSKKDDKMISEAAVELAKIAKKIRVKEVVLCPFAHLDSKIAPAKYSFMVIKGLEKKLIEKGLKVKRAHFGSYKEVKIHLPAHPFEVFYREFPTPFKKS